MGISGIGNVVSAYQYANQIRSKQVSSSGFTKSLNEAITADNKIEAYKDSLQEKYGVPIMVTNAGKDQNSMDRFAGGTSGSGNVAIAPNILEQMANDPEKAAYYEKQIQEYYNYGRQKSEMAAALIGHRVTSDGLIIHEDGTVTHYTSIEEDPKEVAKFEVEQRAKREKKARQKEENAKRTQKALEERSRFEANSYNNYRIDNGRGYHTQGYLSSEKIEKAVLSYEAGILSDNADAYDD